MKNKLVTINIDGESNIGILNLGDLSHTHKDDFVPFFTRTVENRLVRALSEHFDYTVKIRVPATIKTFHPLTIEYIVLIEKEEEDIQETVTLNETWEY